MEEDVGSCIGDAHGAAACAQGEGVVILVICRKGGVL